IIDGLDEDNESSRRLVQSLLQEFKYCSNIAFLCTSRPEKVENFRRTIPAEYTVQHATLHGISRTNVEQFVRLNHQEITKQTGNNRNTDELVRRVMKSEGLQEHLRLPMNLILMIYIWDHDPDQLNLTSVTHTELYYNIHQLCKHKLKHRLTNHQDTKDIDDRKLKVNIDNVLITIYKTALESLSRDQINLEEETVDKLISTCDNWSLPYKEVLSAFLCLRPTWTMLGIQEQYSAPHKGIQDYFAALYIVNMLKQQYSTPTPASATPASATPASATPASATPASATPASATPASATPASATPATPASATPASATPASATPASATPASATPASATPVSATPASTTSASATPDTPVSIKRVLEVSIRSGEVDINKYQNVVIHVAGLLHLVLDQVPETAAREVVHLLQESGMRHNNQWLHLLDNTNMSPVIVKEISHLFNTKETIEVRDGRVRSCAALLPHLSS
ncbi:hypothetical protein OTU49_013438, partial [Cherax quadricarinatus]